MSDLLVQLENLGFSPKRISTVDGGEFSSSCPACGGGGKGKASDRFHVWPLKENKSGLCTGRFWCRQCDVSGDSIEFMQKFYKMSFMEACSALDVHLPNNAAQGGSKRYQPSPQLPEQNKDVWVPREYQTPAKLWQEKAGNLLADCKTRLMGNQEQLAWLASRGINEQMAAQYNLGYNLSSKGGDRYRPRSAWGLEAKQDNAGKDKKLWLPQGWVIPAFDREQRLIQLRIRRRDEDIASFGGNIKYLPIDGSSMATMVLHPEAEIFVVVECGFDAILIAGLFAGKIGAVTTWNSSARPDVMAHEILSASCLILNGLDYDQGGEREQAWWSQNYSQNTRLPKLTKGNDPGEAFANGADLKAWVMAGIPKGLRIRFFGEGSTIVAPKKQPTTTKAIPVPAIKNEVSLAESKVQPITMRIGDGIEICVVDNQQDFLDLSGGDLPVFSMGELEHLKVVTATMNTTELNEALRKIIDIKQVFGAAYIYDGRAEKLQQGE